MAEASQTGRTVARRAGIVTVGTFGSRILGMLRDIVIASSFPVLATDAFFVAFTIPSTLRVLLGEGAVQNAFVPVFADVQARQGPGAARMFLSRFAGSMLTLLTLATVTGIALAPWLGGLYAAGYRDDPEQLALVVHLTRWLFPFLLAVGAAALGAGALNSVGRFGLPAVTPGLMNVAMIACALGLTGTMTQLGMPTITALAIGAVLGCVMHAAANAIALHQVDLLPRPRLGFADPDVKRALTLMVPLLAGVGIHQVNILLSRMFASFLPAGSQSYLSYGLRVVEIPQGMFAIAVAAATLPTLARMRSEGRDDELKDLFRYTLRMTAFVAVPASVGLVCLAEPTIATLFGRGAFGAEQVAETARSMRFQALGILPLAGVRAVIPVFSAHHDTRAPVACAGLSLLTFVTAATLLMGGMAHAGLALAASLAGLVQLTALLLWLRRRIGPLGLGSLVGSLGRTLVSALAMGAALELATSQLDVAAQDQLPRVALYGALVVGGGLVYLAVARLVRSPELTEVLATVRRRAGNTAKTP